MLTVVPGDRSGAPVLAAGDGALGFRGAEDKQRAVAAVKAFEAACRAKFPKAVAKITGDLDQLLAGYDYPCEHWVHLRTANPKLAERTEDRQSAEAAAAAVA